MFRSLGEMKSFRPFGALLDSVYTFKDRMLPDFCGEEVLRAIVVGCPSDSEVMKVLRAQMMLSACVTSRRLEGEPLSWIVVGNQRTYTSGGFESISM